MGRAREGDGRGIGRREFLVFGLASAASSWLTGWGRAATVWAEEAIGDGASVGYLLGSESFTRVDRLPWLLDGPLVESGSWTVVPAGSLPAGEPVLAVEGIRIRIHGLVGGDAAAAGLPRMAELDVLVEPAGAVEGEPPLPFHAWRMVRHGDLVEESPPVSFDLLVDREDGLVLSLRVSEEPTTLRRIAGAAGTSSQETRRRTARFGLAGDAGPKLLRGIYFLGLHPGSYDAVRALHPASLPGQPDAVALVISIDSASAGDVADQRTGGERRRAGATESP